MNTHRLKKTVAMAILTAVLGGTFASVSAEARPSYWRNEDWGRGRWIHDRHSGRLGWWWVVGGMWYWYPTPHSFVIAPQPPVIMQQAPPVIVQQAPVVPPPPQPMAAPPPVPAAPVLYYCKATGTHYPETMSCPGGWMTMTAETPPIPPPAGAPPAPPAMPPAPPATPPTQ
jgi:hypothetical protein